MLAASPEAALPFNRILLTALLLCCGATAAQARSNPEPRPSGIVVHLFGPDSIMSHLVPGLPGETPAPAAAPAPAANAAPQPGAQPGAAQSGAAQSGGAQSQAQPIATATPAAAAAPANDDVPSLGAVLHQMFVVGDPEHPSQPSPGRAAQHLNPGN